MLSDSWLIIHFPIFLWTCSPSILVLTFFTRGGFQTRKFCLFAQCTAVRHQMFLLSFKSDCFIVHVKSSSKSKHANKSKVIWVEISFMRLLGWYKNPGEKTFLQSFQSLSYFREELFHKHFFLFGGVYGNIFYKVEDSRAWCQGLLVALDSWSYC